MGSLGKTSAPGAGLLKSSPRVGLVGRLSRARQRDKAGSRPIQARHPIRRRYQNVEYGVSLLPDCDPETTTASQYFQDVLQVSVLADRLGLNYVKMTEHYQRTNNRKTPSPQTNQTTETAHTQSIR